MKLAEHNSLCLIVKLISKVEYYYPIINIPSNHHIAMGSNERVETAKNVNENNCELRQIVNNIIL